MSNAKRRFELTKGKTRSFTEIEVVGASVVTHYGRIGGSVQTLEKQLESGDAAREFRDQRVAALLAEGGVEVEVAPEHRLAQQHDIVLGTGKHKSLAGDHAINGWVILTGGTLEVSGHLSCLGAIVEAKGQLSCKTLVTNVLEIDNDGGGTKLITEHVRARLVHLVAVSEALELGRPFATLLESGGVEYDYLQHFGGELNPSFDYQKGTLGLARKFFRETRGGEIYGLDIDGIKHALGREQVFTAGPLVAPLEHDVRIDLVDPIASELAAWLEHHPGPQRAVLDALRAEWLDRLRGAAVSKLIKKAISSPKLATARDALLAEIGSK